MTILHLRFPGGRYHATPSGHHVNEGQIEWPPSPWRLLRAFIATGYARLGWTTVPDTAQVLFSKLASVLPAYRLPPAHTAHSRHYMPLGTLDKGVEKTTLVFDTWADVGTGCMTVTWPMILNEPEQCLLSVLVENLGYLGRSESWVEAALAQEPGVAGASTACLPCETHSSPGPEFEQVAVLAPMPPETYAAWRAPMVEQALAEFPLAATKKPSTKLLKDREKAEAPFPNSLIDALQWDTARWKNHRWGQPPGSRRVLYWRAMDALEVGAPTRRAPFPVPSVECMLLALATSSRNRSALPVTARTLPQAELLHRAMVARVAHGDRVECPELTGKDAFGHPLRGHRHARILPLDLDGDGHLEHVLIHARMGLGAAAQRTIRSLRQTWQKHGHDLQVTLIGGGNIHDLRRLPESLFSVVDKLLGSPAGSIRWRSSTPYVPPRFPKKQGANTVIGQVVSELRDQDYPPARVVLLPWDAANARLRHAVRVRGGKAKAPPVDCGYIMEIQFDTPVFGPIALGYASHYGLGQFHACADNGVAVQDV